MGPLQGCFLGVIPSQPLTTLSNLLCGIDVEESSRAECNALGNFRFRVDTIDDKMQVVASEPAAILACSVSAIATQRHTPLPVFCLVDE